jgi:DNA-binding response OmpR family regulator
VQWLAGADSPVGLIGCSQDGDTGLREMALATGFDDFVTGEISVRELAARIRALARRMGTPSQQGEDGPRFGKILYDGGRYQVWVSGRRVRLTRTQLAVMRALIAARGRALTRREILDAAWADNLDVGERAVDNVILRLRRKLGDPRLIVTVRGVGFRLSDS